MNDTKTKTLAEIDRTDFRAIADALPIPVTEIDLDYKIWYMNEQAQNLLSLSPTDIEKGLYVKDVVSPTQVRSVHQGLTRLLDGVKQTPMNLRVKRRDGVEIFTESYATLIIHEKQPVGYVIFSIDMTRRNAIEEKLRQQEGLFQIILDSSQFLGIIIVDDKYTIEYANDMFCEILGRTRREVLRKDFRDFLHPDSLDLVAERYVRRQRGEDVPSMYNFKVVRKDGEIRDLRISSSTMMSGEGIVKTVGQLLDITEDLKYRIALEESEHKHRTLIETMDSGLCVDDENGICLLANQALCDMLGYASPDDLIGKTITLWIHGWTQKEIKEKVEERKKGRHEHYELTLRKKTGELIPAIVHASPWLDANGNYLGSFAVFTDISDLKRTEAEARFLLDLLLHDIGNQLQLILAGADLLDAESTPPEIENARRYVIDGATRCIELINNIRRAEESKSEPLNRIDLAYVLRTQIRLFSGQYGITPELDGIPDEVIVRANAALGHLFWNLMENAVKHNPKPDKRVWITGRKGTRYFTLTFADNGPGLDHRQKARLFDPTRRSSGVGIHLVRRLASKFDAHLSVDDRVSGEPEKGLEVTIRFPIAE